MIRREGGTMEFRKSYLILSALFVLTVFYGCAGPTTTRPATDDAAVALEAQKQREYAVRESLRNQQRLYKVGWPILVARLPLCVDRNRWAVGCKTLSDG